jgi:hypothetical protein
MAFVYQIVGKGNEKKKKSSTAKGLCKKMITIEYLGKSKSK